MDPSIFLLIGLVLFLLIFWGFESKPPREKFYTDDESLYGSDAFLFLRVESRVPIHNGGKFDHQDIISNDLSYEFVILSEQHPEITSYVKHYGPIVALKAPSFDYARSMMRDKFKNGEYDKLWVPEIDIGNGGWFDAQTVVDLIESGVKLRTEARTPFTKIKLRY